ncbi:hypothetical protein ACHAWF_013682 [Thalassiosira exigua]
MIPPHEYQDPEASLPLFRFLAPATTVATPARAPRPVRPAPSPSRVATPSPIKTESTTPTEPKNGDQTQPWRTTELPPTRRRTTSRTLPPDGRSASGARSPSPRASSGSRPVEFVVVFLFFRLSLSRVAPGRPGGRAFVRRRYRFRSFRSFRCRSSLVRSSPSGGGRRGGGRRDASSSSFSVVRPAARDSASGPPFAGRETGRVGSAGRGSVRSPTIGLPRRGEDDFDFGLSSPSSRIPLLGACSSMRPPSLSPIYTASLTPRVFVSSSLPPAPSLRFRIFAPRRRRRDADAFKEGADYQMTSYAHPRCFQVPPRAYKGVSPEDFVNDVLEDRTTESLLSDPDRKRDVVDAVAYKPPRASKGGKAGGDESTATGKRLASVRKVAAELPSDDEGEEVRPSKKAKKGKKGEGEDLESLARAMKVYDKTKADDLKAALRWNLGYATTGNKDALLLRCIDGHAHGRLAR